MAIGDVTRKTWVQTEAAFDTVAAFAAADAYDALDLNIEPTYNFEEINASVGTGSHQGETAQDRGGKWSSSVDVKYSAAGTAPDYGDILKAAYGTETVVGGTSVTYVLSDGKVFGTSLHSLQFFKYIDEDCAEIITGAWVEQVTLEYGFGKHPKLTFQGGFSTYGWLYGSPTVDGVHAGSDTTIAVAAGTAQQVGPNMYVQFGSEDNSGAGYKVVSIAADIITITPGLANGLSGGEEVKPLALSQTIGGTRIAGVGGGLSLDATAIGQVSFKGTLGTGIKPLDKSSGSDRPIGIHRADNRKVDGELELYFLDENTKYLGGAWNGTTRALIHRAGANTAGARQKWNAPKARIVVSPVPASKGDITIYKAAFRARQSAAAADEHTLAYD